MISKKSYLLAIKDLNRVNQEYYAVSAKAARYGFIFGINAKKHYDEHIEAITEFEAFLEENYEFHSRATK